MNKSEFIIQAVLSLNNGDSDLYNTDNTKQMIISIGKKLGFTDNEIEEITDCHIL
jgi:hypothetical protein